MPRVLTLAARTDLPDAHILLEPSSRARSLCGHRPILMWQRIWVEILNEVDQVPACAECRGALRLLLA